MPFINRVGSSIALSDESSEGFLDVANRITSYQKTITVNGTTRYDVVDRSTGIFIGTGDYYTLYESHSDSTAEGNKCIRLYPSSSVNDTTTVSYYPVGYYTTILSGNGGGHKYLIAARVKASVFCQPQYVPSLLFGMKYEDGSDGSYHKVIPFSLDTEWRNVYAVVTADSDKYAYSLQLGLPRTYGRPTYYIDWLAIYDVTDTDWVSGVVFNNHV